MFKRVSAEEAVKIGQAVVGSSWVLASNWFAKSHAYLGDLEGLRAQYALESHPGSLCSQRGYCGLPKYMYLANLHPQKYAANTALRVGFD